LSPFRDGPRFEEALEEQLVAHARVQLACAAEKARLCLTFAASSAAQVRVGSVITNVLVISTSVAGR
jgi:hypothetical protein